jgi:hypothetical protein
MLMGPNADRVYSFLYNSHHISKIMLFYTYGLLIDNTVVTEMSWKPGYLLRSPIKSTFSLAMAGALSVVIDTSVST